MGQKVVAKGVDDKIVITIQDENWEEGNKSLCEYILNNNKFLEHAKVVLDVGDEILRSNDLFSLRNFLNDNKITLVSIIATQNETNTSANLLGIENKLTEKTKPHPRLSNSNPGKQGLVIRKTVRSGMMIESESDIVIIGDVNPGAVVKSYGSVIVWGKLRGEILAGINKDLTNIVAALEFNPSVITLGEFRLDGANRKTKEPEVAYIVNNAIKIESWKKLTY